MNTCDTCKHWKSHSELGYDPGYEWCREFGECSLMEEAGPKSIVELDRLVLIPDYGESVLTGPKFGCLHHSPKS